MDTIKYIVMSLLFFPLGAQVLNVIFKAFLFVGCMIWYRKGWEEFDNDIKRSSLKMAFSVFLHEVYRLIILLLYYFLLVSIFYGVKNLFIGRG